MDKTKSQILKLTYAAVCLALCMILPIVTGGIPAVGKYLCPMHLPVLLCGVLCGPVYGFAVGLCAPILRFALFGSPLPMPHGVGMTAELAVYGLVAGLILRWLLKRNERFVRAENGNFLVSLYVSLVCAMLAGRIAGGLMKIVLLTAGKIQSYAFGVFVTSYFVETIPGVIAQLILIPAVAFALRRAKLMP